MTPDIRKQIEEAAAAHVEKIWGDTGKRHEHSGTDIDFTAGAEFGYGLASERVKELEDWKFQTKHALAIAHQAAEDMARALDCVLEETWILTAADRDRWQNKVREALTNYRKLFPGGE